MRVRRGCKTPTDQFSGEKLLTALDPLCAGSAPDGGRDPRTKGHRCADGFVEMVSAYLANPDRPVAGGVVARVALTVPLPVLIPTVHWPTPPEHPGMVIAIRRVPECRRAKRVGVSRPHRCGYVRVGVDR